MDVKILSEDVRAHLRSTTNVSSITQCVMELVLNALDAQATSIAIRINLQTFRIQVVDNGNGISESNMQFVGLRYMTNKCHTLKDLKRIKTAGFRGEALTSICGMSTKLTIVSRVKDSHNTYTKICLNNRWGEVESTKQRPSEGTTCTIDNFMYNMPVRQKRINALEFDEIKRSLEVIAIINPTVSLSLRNDSTGKIVLQTNKTQTVCESLLQFFPDILPDKLLKFKATKGKIVISGLVYANNLPTSKLQLVYLNKRHITCQRIGKVMQNLLTKSTGNLLFVARDTHPAYVLNIKCPYSEVDLTLSPTKKTAEFKHWDIIINCIEKGVCKLLGIEITAQTRVETVEENNMRSQCGVSQIEGAVHSKLVKRKLHEMSGNIEKVDVDSPIEVCNESPSKVEKIEVTSDAVFKVPENKRKPALRKVKPVAARKQKKVDNLCSPPPAKLKGNQRPSLQNVSTNLQLSDDQDAIKEVTTNLVEPTVFDRHANTQSLVLNSESDVNPLLDCTITANVLEDQLQGKCLIMDMFLKSTIAFPREPSLKTILTETTKRNICKSINTGVTMSFKLTSKKTVINSIHPAIEYDKKVAENMTSKCIQTTMFEKQDKVEFNFNCPYERNCNFTFSKYFGNPVFLTPDQLFGETKTPAPAVGNAFFCPLINKPAAKRGYFNAEIAKRRKRFDLGRNFDRPYFVRPCLQGNFDRFCTNNRDLSNRKRDENACRYFCQYPPLLTISSVHRQRNSKAHLDLNPGVSYSPYFNKEPESAQQTSVYFQPNCNRKPILLQKDHKPTGNIVQLQTPSIFNSGQSVRKPEKIAAERRHPPSIINFEERPKAHEKTHSMKLKGPLFKFESSKMMEKQPSKTQSLYEQAHPPFHRKDFVFKHNANVPSRDEQNICVPKCKNLNPNFAKLDEPAIINTGKVNESDFAKLDKPLIKTNNTKNLLSFNQERPLIKPSSINLNKGKSIAVNNNSDHQIRNNPINFYRKLFCAPNNVNYFKSANNNKAENLFGCPKRKETNCNFAQGKNTFVPRSKTTKTVEKPPFWPNEPPVKKLRSNAFPFHENATAKQKPAFDVFGQKSVCLNRNVPASNMSSTQNQIMGDLEKMTISRNTPETKCYEWLFSSLAAAVMQNKASSSNCGVQCFTPKDARKIKRHHTEPTTCVPIPIIPPFKKHKTEPLFGCKPSPMFYDKKEKAADKSSTFTEVSPNNVNLSPVILTPQDNSTNSKDSPLNISISTEKRLALMNKTANKRPESSEKTDEDGERVKKIDGTIHQGNLWKQEFDSRGNKYYLHKRTGMTSLISPKEDTHFSLLKRISFLPKGLSPILIEPKKVKGSLSPNSKIQLNKAIIQSYRNELNTVKWSNYIGNGTDINKFFEELYKEKSKQFEDVIPNIALNTLPKSMIRLWRASKAQSFTKDLFKKIRLIGQLDNKFIVTIADKLVVLLDQHALHERIRLEQLYKHYKDGNNNFKSTAFDITLSSFEESEMVVLINYEKLFGNIGLFYYCRENRIEIYGVPTCIYNRFIKNAKHKDHINTIIKSLIQEHSNTITSSRGNASNIPNIIKDTINKEACRGAIKFGAKLSKEQCSQYIEKLAECNLPFQCAHGRPTLMPVIDIRQAWSKQKVAPNLKKLKSTKINTK